jgi:hypothetical protein
MMRSVSTASSTANIPLVWIYEQGAWSRASDPVMAEHGVPDEDYNDWLYHAGYSPADHWCGTTYTTAIYESHGEGENGWRIEFSMDAARKHVIMVKQFPDLIELLSKLAPIALASGRGQQAPPGAGH